MVGLREEEEAGGVASILGARRRGLLGPKPLPAPDVFVEVLEVLDRRDVPEAILGVASRSTPLTVASEPLLAKAWERAEAAEAFFLRRLRFPEAESPLLFVVLVPSEELSPMLLLLLSSSSASPLPVFVFWVLEGPVGLGVTRRHSTPLPPLST